MKVLFDEDRVKRIINRYYQDLYGIEGDTVVNVSKGYVMYDEEYYLNVSYQGKTLLLGEETEISINVSENDLKNIITGLLEENGYIVHDFEINIGMESKLEGYYIYEHYVSYPRFKGVEVEIEEKVKKIGGRK